MFRHVLVLGICFALLSCAGGSSNQQASKSAAHHAKAAGGEATAATQKAKATESTASVREPESSTAKASVLDQGNDEGDLDLTQRIRKQLLADDALSFSAKNVKIITKDGVVTLAGAVKNETEANEVRQKATAEAGQGHVKDELQISP